MRKIGLILTAIGVIVSTSSGNAEMPPEILAILLYQTSYHPTITDVQNQETFWSVRETVFRLGWDLCKKSDLQKYPAREAFIEGVQPVHSFNLPPQQKTAYVDYLEKLAYTSLHWKQISQKANNQKSPETNDAQMSKTSSYMPEHIFHSIKLQTSNYTVYTAYGKDPLFQRVHDASIHLGWSTAKQGLKFDDFQTLDRFSSILKLLRPAQLEFFRLQEIVSYLTMTIQQASIEQKIWETRRKLPSPRLTRGTLKRQPEQTSPVPLGAEVPIQTSAGPHGTDLSDMPLPDSENINMDEFTKAIDEIRTFALRLKLLSGPRQGPLIRCKSNHGLSHYAQMITNSAGDAKKIAASKIENAQIHDYLRQIFLLSIQNLQHKTE